MNQKSVASSVKTVPLLACLALAGCTSADSSSLQDGFKKYVAQQPVESEAIADRYLAANPSAPDIDQAYYLRGISRMTRGNRAGAIPDLHTAITKTTRADLRSKAYRALGDMAYDQQQWPDAIKNYQAALDNLTLDAASVTYLNYRMGETLQCQGEWTRSEPWFARVVAARNDPTLTDPALRRMHATGFAIQFGAFQEVAGAQALAAQLRAAGIAPLITNETRTDARNEARIWFLVQSGSYPNWAEALKARDGARSKFPAAMIVP